MIDDHKRKEAERLLGQGLGCKKIAAMLKMSHHTIKRIRDGIGGIRTCSPDGKSFGRLPEIPNSVKSFEYQESDTEAIITRNSSTIRTLEALLEEGNVDLTVWRVKRHVINKWDMAAKIADADGNQDLQATELWQVKAWFERIPKEEAAANRLTQSLKSRPITPSITVIDQVGNFLAVVGMCEPHFGMYAYEPETGTNYDLEIAEKNYLRTNNQLLQKLHKLIKPSMIVIPLGSDFFHVNDRFNETPQNKNKLDVDGRFGKVFETGMRAAIQVIANASKIAPVRVVYVPGNHDAETSLTLSYAVLGHFSGNKRIHVDIQPAPRKYYRFGVNLIGFAHGDKTRHDDLARLMASERAKDWGQTTTQEWLTGHLHNKRRMILQTTASHGPVVVHTLPSIAGTDCWHSEHGYVGTRKASEAFIYSKSGGYYGQLSEAV